jgi:hypothetical protein
VQGHDERQRIFSFGTPRFEYKKTLTTYRLATCDVANRVVFSPEMARAEQDASEHHHGVQRF